MRLNAITRGMSICILGLLGGVAVAQHSTATYTQVVNKGTGTITITPSVNPSAYTQPVTFTAALPAAATGSVTFFDGATSIGAAVPVASGAAAATTSALSVGSHTITATYSGDTNYAGGTSTALTQVVTKGPSGLTLASAPNPSIFGNSVAFTASLASTATGNVTFFDGSTSIGVSAASSGTAVLNTSALTVGSHSITAQYAGDGNFSPLTSNIVSQTVNKAGTTSNVLTSSLNPATYAASVIFTATLPGNATGNVTFLDGSTSIGTVTISSGVATLTTSALTAGTHSITASYAGDTNYAPSPSNIYSELVNKQTSEAIVLTSGSNPAVMGTSVVFTAKLPADATGTVTFFDGATSLGTGTIAAGVATFTTSTLTVGTHPVTATYNGDSNYSNVTSPAYTQTINQGSATMGISGIPNPSLYGNSVVMTITVTGINGVIPTGTVTLLDGVSPLGSTLSLDATGKATFTTSALTAGSHPITATYSGDSNYR